MSTGIPPFQCHFSLTNQIEFVQVDNLFGASNQFEMIRVPEEPTQINERISAFNIFSKQYVAYLMTGAQPDRVKITPVSFSDNLKSNSTYFFVNRNITVLRDRLEIRLLDIWRMRAGTRKMGNKCFPQQPIRFPYIMPSRGKVFR